MITGYLLDLINLSLSTSFEMTDFQCVHKGRSYGYYLGEDYFVKTDNKDYDYEKEALQRLENASYVPKVYLFDDPSKTIVMERVKGVSLQEWLNNEEVELDTLLDYIFDYRTDMLENHKIYEVDNKLKEIFVVEDGIKKVDYGMVDIFNDQENIKPMIERYLDRFNSVKEGIRNNDPKYIKDFNQKLLGDLGIAFGKIKFKK